jgi:DNA-binding Lrp family transcriptional regulator
MDDRDKQLLVFLQNGIPVEKRPFEGFARRLGLDIAETLLRIGRLKSSGRITDIRGIFDSKSMGYKSSLVAMKSDARETERQVSLLEEHPGVYGIHLREHDLNLWFTLALPPEASLEHHVGRLQDLMQSPCALLLPVIRIFKPGQHELPRPEAEEKHFKRNPANDDLYREDGRFSVEELGVIRLLQQTFPLTDEPFRRMAAELELDEERVFTIVRSLFSKGHLRSLGAVIESSKVQDPHHMMVLWALPAEKLEHAGRQIARMDFVKHCASRLSYPHFPYSLYVTLRSASFREASEHSEAIERLIGPWPRIYLPVTQICSRKRICYFSNELGDWWNRTGRQTVDQEDRTEFIQHISPHHSKNGLT